MKYFIYTRKSTDSEERQVLSIESQISELKEFAAKEKLEIVQSERVASAGGRKGGLGGIPPALQILGEISSNFFERTPPGYLKWSKNRIRRWFLINNKSDKISL
ncbi:MAG: hypothetical protein A2109_02975 [Candidatus Wildermuthbacteria bacterium GWA1_49_26]|uniref:Recombinase n=1 Tax=Candidatus Yanofskybacteria bacterium GW2011_GWC1_48_11 TaxID=1619027 RepID=A0A837IKB2_9BACT|nr:MAG: recombinase [Candidatus Yanofskybacteria bacterium GW2011_GWC1_48_11]KKW03379.1 MAG: Recombinase [Parcubacteria group bacterium GW2011_GWB1_49_12]KKW08309.1 MAG: Recombinase [Parcubacteria group bacterium GW2011_GWA1_49_26]KKW13309.1 MAG: Recombinase [Parcubacteria group bacterium GW2011_GWA2_50_10]OHA61891.1 MAG: hypothetical protein A2109_02975 [Candidatus Wildermuthbacteria bacterium GWA1_49_26]OHA66387.1 MAG: hypothetical protein A2674_03560 [Candidatus Wildermuthbacteria bacterium